ncbi:MAG: hypothetical protein WCT05_02730 [Lentisphaeria bacterium]
MSRLISALFAVLTSILAASPRIAVFAEPGFPNASKRDAGFYTDVLGGTGIILSELDKLKDFEVVIFPHGGYLPYAADMAVGELLSRGGSVIVTGDLQTPSPSGGLAMPGLLEYDKTSGEWVVLPKGAVYNVRVAPKWYPEFDLRGWPNYASSNGKSYMRAFNEVVKLNPILKSSLPQEIQAPSGKAPGLSRLVPNSQAGDYAFDVYIPLYLFDKPSGNSYSPFKDAGKSEEDRAADAYIYRRFRPFAFAGTLVVMGQTGRQLLESEAGAETIREIVRLSTQALPGELEHTYIRRFLALEEAMAEFNNVNQALTSALARAATKTGEQEKYLRSMKQKIRQFNHFNNAFDALAVLKNHHKKVAEKKLIELSDELNAETKKTQLELAEVLPRAPLIDRGDAKHHYREFVFTAFGFGPWGTFAGTPLWNKVKEIGITNPALHDSDWEFYRQLNQKYGFGTGYRFWYIERGHSEKQTVSSAVFDPNTGSVKAVSANVFSKEIPQFDQELIPILQEAEENPGVTTIVHGEERDLQWSLWGPYMREKFLEYLKQRYKVDISALNKEYISIFSSFDEIILPLKRPETQSEHALWEDWTRYREIYRIKEEMEHRVGLVKKYAPSTKQWLYGSYHMQRRHPANGINYYEHGQLVNPSSLESGSQSPWKEVIANDITAFGRKHVNPEWADFYFPPGSHRDCIHRMRQSLWNEANCGTIGWFLYMGGQQGSRWNVAPLMTPGGNIQPVGYELRSITRDFHAARRLFLDGQRAEPELRFIYSPTTRRHTSWPGIEEDRSLDCVTGWNEACKRLHIPARAIDEQPIMEGKLSQECRFLLLPRVEYLNRELFIRLQDFMKGGGTLVATADSGRFDQYGHRIDVLAELAGVRVFPYQSGMVEEYQFEILFSDETKPLIRKENSITATSTQVGKGRLILIGSALGQIFNATGAELEQINSLLAEIGVMRPFRCNDPNLVIRPWVLDGEAFLACHYLYKANTKRKDGGFPLGAPVPMVEFDLELAGHFEIEDWLLGVKLESSFEAGKTNIKGLIENPGGKIYRLIRQGSAKNDRSLSPTAVQAPSIPVLPKQSFQIPCSERFFADWGKIELGDAILICESENEGAWQGKIFASLTRGNQTMRRECGAGDTVNFRFVDKTIRFECSDASAVMPVHVTGRFSEFPTQSSTEGCRLSMEKGSIFMSNPHLFVRILPDFGGRIAELRSSEDAPNQLLLRESELAKGLGTIYRDYGGIEYTPGRYQGPGWGIQYETEVISNTPEQISIRLKRSQPIKLHNGPKVSYEIVYSLKKDSSLLEAAVRMYNEDSAMSQLRLTTHPLFRIGGDCNYGDTFYWMGEKGLEVGVYKPGRNEYVTNRGDWYAYVDARAAEGVLQTFSAAVVPRLYAWTGNDSYNVELPFAPVETPLGQFAEFSFGIGVLTGFNTLNGYADGLLAELNAGARELTFRMGATSRRQVSVQCRIFRNNETIKEFAPEMIPLIPGVAATRHFPWDSSTLPDGLYVFEVSSGEVKFRRDIPIDRASEHAKEKDRTARMQQWQKLQQEYRQNPSPELRAKIFRMANE